MIELVLCIAPGWYEGVNDDKPVAIHRNDRRNNMALEMKQNCEKCDTAFQPGGDAFICVFECTFCRKCADQMQHICPNCGGELVARPKARGPNTQLS